MHKLTQIGEGEYRTNYIKRLSPIYLPEEDVQDCMEFAYDMTFGKVGQHRNIANGSSYQRSDSEIFANVLQGKVGEFAVRNYLASLGLDVSDVDLRRYQKGRWDNGDLVLGNDLISVKSSPSYVNFLKLNANDYDERGRYKFGRSADDYIMYTRVLPNVNKVMRDVSYEINTLISQDALTCDDIERLILEDTWSVDLPGYITRGDFAEEVIGNDLKVYKGEKIDNLGMFHDVYYTQTGDLRELDTLADLNDYDDELEL